MLALLYVQHWGTGGAWPVLDEVPDLLRMLPFPSRTGLQRVGDPGPDSPVVLTGNFRLTVQRVRRAMAGLDAWLLVANSRGVNVCCAATGGLLSDHDVVSVLKTSGIADLVDHHRVLLPQLAATGIDARTVRQRSGWQVIWGPAEATDIPQFLASGPGPSRQPTHQGMRDMRTVTFPLRRRLEMAVAWAFPISIATLVLLAFRPSAVVPAIGLSETTCLGQQRMASSPFGRGFIEGWWHSDDPVTAIRVITANLDRLERWQQRKANASRLRPSSWRAKRRPDRSMRNREDIAAHYDIGTDFFALFLDDSLTYPAGVFPSHDATLHEASVNKYDRLLDKLHVGPGDRVLEIGTGWGGFALHAASTRGCHVTTTTVSADQYREAERRIKTAGLSRPIELLDVDWRYMTGRYAKVVSIEMIEAVSWRDYGRFFATIERCLAPDGVVGLQAICVPGRRFKTAKHTDDFIKRFVFPGGGLPSLDTLATAMSGATRLQLTDVEDLSAHYAETLARWRQRFEQSKAQVAELGFDERFSRLWRFSLAYCEAAFAERHRKVNQLVLVGPDWRPDGLGLRPH